MSKAVVPEVIKDVSPDQVSLVNEIFGLLVSGRSFPEIAGQLKMSIADVSSVMNASDYSQRKLTEAIEARDFIIREEIFGVVRDIAVNDIRCLYDDDGKLKDPHLWPDGISKAVNAVGAGTVKLESKIKAIELLMKKYGELTPKIEIEHSVKLEDIMDGVKDV